MTAALFAKAFTLLILVLCKQGLTEEQNDAASPSEPESREKRGLNMLRLGRGLQMLRLGKRGLNMLRLGRSSPSGDDLSEYLYNVDSDGYVYAPETLNGEDDYMRTEGGRYRRSTEEKRAVALPRFGKEIENEDFEEYLKQALEEKEIEENVPEGDEEKRALSMLRLGKRPMSMLRLGKRPMSMLRLGKRPMSMLRLGKRPMSMLRLGKRPMSMLRLGKRPMSMLRLGKRPMNMLRLGKRPMSMLRLGKREDDQAEGEEKRALGMLRLGKRSSETVQQDTAASTQ